MEPIKHPLATYLLWFDGVSSGIREQIAMFVIASAPHGVFDYQAGDAPSEVLRSHMQRASAELRFSAELYRMNVAGLALILGSLTEAAFHGRTSAKAWQHRRERMERDRAEIETLLGPRAADLIGGSLDVAAWGDEYERWCEFRRTSFSEDAIVSWVG